MVKIDPNLVTVVMSQSLKKNTQKTNKKHVTHLTPLIHHHYILLYNI